ncbi:PLP-dependent aminotransferase family protein [Sneathiella marina]|uniref:PLP-dependent aminotransferase family protein n=1 Tax=Sneathiella marina TaxID=2950108 RepID=A0ABY4W5G1_9PROT|nr:PLP-dependent aminotransferase family protein [Sneathiella marina]USG62428.1 PLP-dependent aminotransferase family protein [Sneathiella marina]
MTNWIPDRDSLRQPLHLSLAASISAAIEDGRLKAGQRLPTHRKLAEQLNLSVNTVSKAYDTVKRQNLIEGQIGRGSYVTDTKKPERQPYILEPEQKNMFDLSISRPAYSKLHVDRMQKLLSELPGDLNSQMFLSCRPNIGFETHRIAGTKWLSLCGLNTQPDNIILTNGVTHGMSAALSALTRPGDIVLSDSITHHLLVSACAYLGLQLVGLDIDEYGVVPDALEKACVELKPKALYLLPSLAGPNIYMMPESRRRQIADIVKKYELHLVENDACGPVAKDRPQPVSEIIPELSIYLTTFTKCTVSGLRAGYLVAPERLFPALTGRLIVFGWMATPLMCEIATRWVLDGTAEELTLWQRSNLRTRYDIARTELAEFDWHGHPSGLHLWLKLPGEWDSASFVAHARQLNIAVSPETPFMAPKSIPQNAIRISVASIRDVDRFQQALRMIAGLLKQQREPLPQLVY